ncbi:MAG: type II toxin-antitoxin system prevent-host-death family antitoxin [Geobacter sp.]|nr:type II toxin-antitoxin system prevent-host-death family antitoxin [Geobacter sp.]
MQQVPVTVFRKHIPEYLGKVRQGEELSLTSRGREVARLVPPEDTRLSAREQLQALRVHCRVGDVVSPIDTEWEAERADS